MLSALFCNACGAQLTELLTIVSGKDPSVARPACEARMTLASRGHAFKSYEPIMRSYADTPAPLEFAPQYWLDPDDLTDVVEATKKSGRLNGCCGLDGLDGPNQICRCGAEIGTLQNDCWTPIVFVPEPAATSWEELPQGIRVVEP